MKHSLHEKTATSVLFKLYISSNSNVVLNIENEVCHDTYKVASYFNDFFH